MDLFLKYEGRYPPSTWAALGGERAGARLWRFALGDHSDDRLTHLLADIANATDSQTLSETQAVCLDAQQYVQTPEALLDTALPFNALLARRQHPWLQEDISTRVAMHFQPVIDMAHLGQVFAHEALCRVRAPDGSLLVGAQAFALAAQLGRQEELDLACQHQALARKARDIGAGVLLFVNVMPTTLLHEGWLTQFMGWLRDFDIDARELVIEVVESERVDAARLAERCDALRAHGLRIALDDVGAGFNGLTTLAMVHADFIKIDRTLVHEAQGSRVRSVLLDTLVSMAERLGATIIAEGLERPEDMAFCQGVGIRYAQGFLFSPPLACPRTLSVSLPDTDDAWRVPPQDRLKLSDLADPAVSFDVDTPIDEVRVHFREAPHLPWAVVLEQDCPIGLVRRGRVLAKTSRTLAACIEPLARQLPATISLSRLARSLYLNRRDNDPWAVTGTDGSYVGVLDPMRLVAQIITQQAHGTNLHPLSQLPTGPSLRQAIDARIAAGGGRLGLVYIDLDHFKAFNDRYGFIRGDAMIRTLAEILRHGFSGRPDRLLGHIGGDDFILILERDEPGLPEQLARIVTQFHALASHLYDEADIVRGFFCTEDHRQHAIASISVAYVNGTSGTLKDSVAAAERAAQLKKLGKAQWGSVLVFEDTPPRVEAVGPRGDSGTWIANAVATLETLVQTPRSRDPHAMDAAFKAYPFFEMLFELDARGAQRYPNWINPAMYGRIRAGGIGVDRSHQPYFAEVAQTGRPFVSPIYLSSASEDFCLTIAIALRDDHGAMTGVLVADLNLAAMAALLDRRETV